MHSYYVVPSFGDFSSKKDVNSDLKISSLLFSLTANHNPLDVTPEPTEIQDD